MKEKIQKLFKQNSLELPQGDFYFAKTEVSEIAHRPGFFTLTLLQKVYEKDGPVDRVYKGFGVKYQDTNFLKIFGNELFVDKEKEIKSLLPTCSFFSRQDGKVRFLFQAGCFRTLKNLFFLSQIKIAPPEKFLQILKGKLASENQERDIQKKFDVFFQDYEIIFEINLLSMLVSKRLEKLLAKEPIESTDVIASQSEFFTENDYFFEAPLNLQGNSLDVQDTSTFVGSSEIPKEMSKKFFDWWQGQSQSKKSLYGKVVKEVAAFNRLRELGRWLNVKNISTIRQELFLQAEKNNFENQDAIFFASWSEIFSNQIDEEKCLQRKKEYEKFSSLFLPSELTSFQISKKSSTQVVSAGIIKGRLVNRKMLGQAKHENDQLILYTENLSPDLVACLDQIKGIVSPHGSLLSHLAIVAREKKVPVLIGFDLAESGMNLGDQVEFDAKASRIKKC